MVEMNLQQLQEYITTYEKFVVIAADYILALSEDNCFVCDEMHSTQEGMEWCEKNCKDTTCRKCVFQMLNIKSKEVSNENN